MAREEAAGVREGEIFEGSNVVWTAGVAGVDEFVAEGRAVGKGEGTMLEKLLDGSTVALSVGVLARDWFGFIKRFRFIEYFSALLIPTIPTPALQTFSAANLSSNRM